MAENKELELRRKLEKAKEAIQVAYDNLGEVYNLPHMMDEEHPKAFKILGEALIELE